LKETLKPLAYSFWSTELNSALDKLQADLNGNKKHFTIIYLVINYLLVLDRPMRFEVEDISHVLTKALKLMQKSDLKIKRTMYIFKKTNKYF